MRRKGAPPWPRAHAAALLLFLSIALHAEAKKPASAASGKRSTPVALEPEEEDDDRAAREARTCSFDGRHDHIASLSAAKRYKHRNNLKNAKVCLRRAARLDPALAEAWTALAEIAQVAGDRTTAEQYRRAAERSPVVVEEQLREIEEGNEAFKDGRYTEALACYERAVTIRPISSSAHYNLASAHHVLKNWTAAFDEYLKTLELDPLQIEAYARMGHVLESQDVPGPNLTGASFYFREAAAKDPKNADLMCHVGRVEAAMGNWSEALDWFGRAARASPALAKAHYGVGLALQRLGRVEAAAAAFQTAADAVPPHEDARHALAMALHAAGRHEEAVQQLRGAIQGKGDVAAWHNELGRILHYALGRPNEAAGSYQRAAELDPFLAEAFYNLGNVLLDRRELDGAIAKYRAAVLLMPGHADLWTNLGNALRARGMARDAGRAYERAIRLRPDYYLPVGNLAALLQEEGRYGEAEALYGRALALEPAYAEGHSNLGALYLETGRAGEAAASLERALAANPRLPEAHNNLGNAHARFVLNSLASMSNGTALERALEAYAASVRLSAEMGVPPGPALFNLYAVRRHLCRWRDFDLLSATVREFAEALLASGQAPDVLPYIHFVYPLSPAAFALIARQCAQRLAARALHNPPFRSPPPPAPVASLPAAPGRPREPPRPIGAGLAEELYPPPSPQPAAASLSPTPPPEAPPIPGLPRHQQPLQPGSRLRIAYVSADFVRSSGPVADLMCSVMGHHDRSRVEVIFYHVDWDSRQAKPPAPPALPPLASTAATAPASLRRQVDGYRDLGALTDFEAASAIHADAPHVLIDLNGYSRGARKEVLAAHPAPIQVHYLGFLGTLGASFIPYAFADAVAVPPQLHFGAMSERLILLPRSFQAASHSDCYKGERPRAAGGVPHARAAAGIPPDAFVFANFNPLYRHDPTLLAVWANVLRRVPRSVLWLLGAPSAGEAPLRAELEAAGVAGRRLPFAAPLPKGQHLARLTLADLFLDDPALSAGSTAADALWAGLPLLSLPLALLPTRVAASALHAAGLPSLVPASLKAYEDRAVALASAAGAELASLRERLRAGRRAAAYFDAAGWARAAEGACRLAYELHAADVPPQHLLAR